MTDSNASFRFDDKMNFDFHAPRRVRVELGSALREAEEAQFVRRLAEVPVAYRFKHTLIQETACTLLTRHERRRLHEITAHVLEAQAGADVDKVSAELAQHYGAAGNDAKALEYATRAGDRAMQVYALAEALTFYTQALDAAERSAASTHQFIHLFTNRGRSLELSDQFDSALANYESMETVARRKQDRRVELQSYMMRANIHATGTSVFDPMKAHQFAGQALELARELGDRAAESKALWNLLVMNRYAGKYDEAIRYGEAALALSRELDLQEQMAFILTDLGAVYMSLGQLALARTLLEEARPLWRTFDNKPMLADNLMLSGVHALVSGNFEQTDLFTAEGAQVSRQIGNAMGLSANQGTQAQARFEQGEMTEALRLGVDVIRRAEQTQIHFSLLLARSTLARIYAEVGALAQACKMAQLASAPMTQEIPGFFRTWAFAMLAHVYIVCGDLRAAEQAVETGKRDQSGTLDAAPGTNLGKIAEAELALAKGDYDRAVQLLHEPVAFLRGAGLRAFLGEMLYLEATTLRARGDIAQAAELLQEAETETQALQQYRMLWQILAAQSEIEIERGDPDRANAYRTQARDVITFLVEHTPEEYRESFRILPRVRKVLA